MIITGAPAEQMDFEQAEYWEELCEIMERSNKHACSTFHMCWEAQTGLYYHYCIPKYPMETKLFDVFPHCVDRALNMMVRGFEEVFMVPHPRQTTIHRKNIEKVPVIKMLPNPKKQAYIFAEQVKTRMNL